MIDCNATTISAPFECDTNWRTRSQIRTRHLTLLGRFFFIEINMRELLRIKREDWLKSHRIPGDTILST